MGTVSRKLTSVLCLCYCALPSTLLSQDGNWYITNGAIGEFAAFATESGVRPLIGDFNNDGRDDVALLRQRPGWATMPVAFATGAGEWTNANAPINDFATWATESGVLPVVGDFDNDGRDDVALLRRSPGWTTLPVAFATASGGWTSWTIKNVPGSDISNFAGLAADIEVDPFVGDFDEDGRDDIALLRRRSPAWSTMPVAHADGSGGWLTTNNPIDDFGRWATESRVLPLLGDFNDDRRGDVALLRQVPGWTTMPVAFSTGMGAWTITNRSVMPFADFATVSDVRPLVGNFSTDRRDDVVLLRQGPGWSGIVFPAFADGSGGWTQTVGNVGAFAAWATVGLPMVGDFNNDGRDDIALLRRTPGWHTMPVAFATGSSNWDITNGGIEDFATWATLPGVLRLVGDFNNDGRDDVALLRQSPGWSTMPVAFATDDTHRLSVNRHTSASITDADADRILTDASSVLQTADSPADVGCHVTLQREGGVGTINVGNGVISSQGELDAVFSAPGNVKVVNAINWCGGGPPMGGTIIGCAPAPGATLVVVRFTANDEGMLWAHEFGHNRGLNHRMGNTLVMNDFIAPTTREVNAAECAAFRGPTRVGAGVPGSGAGTVTVLAGDLAAASQVSIDEFVLRNYVHGLPYDEASRFGADAIPRLMEMLGDPQMKPYWANIIGMLGIVGNEETAQVLIRIIEQNREEALDPENYRASLSAILALGHIANGNPPGPAFDFLVTAAQGVFSSESGAGTPDGLRLDAAAIGESAVLGLALSGQPRAGSVLEELRAPDGLSEALLTDAKSTLSAVQEQGLPGFFQSIQR